jgi:hypothetical protein
MTFTASLPYATISLAKERRCSGRFGWQNQGIAYEKLAQAPKFKAGYAYRTQALMPNDSEDYHDIVIECAIEITRGKYA